MRQPGATRLRRLLPLVGRYVPTAIIAITAVLILLHDLVQPLIPLDTTQLLAITMAALAALLVEFSTTLSQSQHSTRIAMHHLSMGDGLRFATRHTKVRVLRV